MCHDNWNCLMGCSAVAACLPVCPLFEVGHLFFDIVANDSVFKLHGHAVCVQTDKTFTNAGGALGYDKRLIGKEGVDIIF